MKNLSLGLLQCCLVTPILLGATTAGVGAQESCSVLPGAGVAAAQSGTGSGRVVLEGTTGVIGAMLLNESGIAAFKLEGVVVMSAMSPMATGRIEGTLKPAGGGDAIAFQGQIAAKPGGGAGTIEGFDMSGAKIIDGKLKLGVLDIRTGTMRGSLQLRWRM